MLGIVAAAIASVAALIAPLAVSLSLATAFLAVTLPQGGALMMQRYLLPHKPPHKPFSLWLVKFSLTLLLLAAFVRALAESGLLAAPYFIVGAVAGVLANVIWLARQAQRQSARSRR